MSDALKPKYNLTVGSVSAPTTSALVTYELAENGYSGRLYLKKEDGTVVDPAKVQISGDATGTTSPPTSNTDGGSIILSVDKLLGRSLSTTAPASLETLVYSTTDGKWTPAAPSFSGFPLSSVAATTDQILVYTTETDSVARWTPTSVPFIKEICKFDGALANATTKAGTYSRSGTDVTVSITAHGFSANHLAYLNFTSGTAVDGEYSVVSVTDANTFHVTTAASGATSGTVQFLICAAAYTTGMFVIYGDVTGTGSYYPCMVKSYAHGASPVVTISMITSGGAQTNAETLWMDYNNGTNNQVARTSNSFGFACKSTSGSNSESGVNTMVCVF
jgi:hypothetical protein